MKSKYYSIIYDKTTKEELYNDFIQDKNFKKEINKNKKLVKNKKSIDTLINKTYKNTSKKIKEIDHQLETQQMKTQQKNKLFRERNDLLKTLKKTIQYKNTFINTTIFKSKSQINKLSEGYYTQNRKKITITKDLQEKFKILKENINKQFIQNLKYIKYQPDNNKSKSTNLGNLNTKNYIDNLIQFVSNTPTQNLKQLIEDIKQIDNKNITYHISNYGLKNYTNLNDINDLNNVNQHIYGIEEIGLMIIVEETNSGRFYISRFKTPTQLPTIEEIKQNYDFWLKIINNTQFIHIISLQKSEDIVNINEYEDDFYTVEFYYQQLKQLINQIQGEL